MTVTCRFPAPEAKKLERPLDSIVVDGRVDLWVDGASAGLTLTAQPTRLHVWERLFEFDGLANTVLREASRSARPHCRMARG